MEYPQSFKDKVKKLYNSDKMNELADRGSQLLGRYLDDSSSGSISIGEILKAKSLESLQEKARVERAKLDLYIEWGDLYSASVNQAVKG